MQYKKPEYCAMIEEYINSYRNRQGSAPSVREIAAGVGLAVSTVSKYLSYMRQNGVLDYDGHRSITTRKSKGLRNGSFYTGRVWARYKSDEASQREQNGTIYSCRFVLIFHGFYRSLKAKNK